jgi:hypothetical protein
MAPPKEQVTTQKYDLQFGTNVIGTCLCFRANHGVVMSPTCRPLVIHPTAVTCPVRGYRRITFSRESAHRDGVIGRTLHDKGP